MGIKITVGSVNNTKSDVPHWRRRKRKGTSPALVLQTEPGVSHREYIKKVIAVPELRAFITDAFVADEENGKLCIAPAAVRLPLPDPNSNAVETLTLIKGDTLEMHDVSSQKLYDSCPVVLIRDTVGCSQCELYGKGCGVPALAEANAIGEVMALDDFTRAEETVLAKAATTAGFTWVAPNHTTTETFAPRYRLWEDMDLDDTTINQKKSDLTDRACAAGATRTFERKECTACPAKEYSCDKAAYCAGRYPDNVAIWTDLLKLRDRVMANSEWTWEQIWALRNFEEQFCQSRERWIFTGFMVQDGKVVGVLRRKTWLRKAIYVKNIEELRAFYKPKRKKDPNPVPTVYPDQMPRLEDTASCLFVLMGHTERSKRMSAGFGHDSTQHTLGVHLTYNGIVFHASKYDVWRWAKYDHTMSTMREYYDYAGALPAAQIISRPGLRLFEPSVTFSFPIIGQDGNG